MAEPATAFDLMVERADEVYQQSDTPTLEALPSAHGDWDVVAQNQMSKIEQHQKLTEVVEAISENTSVERSTALTIVESAPGQMLDLKHVSDSINDGFDDLTTTVEALELRESKLEKAQLAVLEKIAGISKSAYDIQEKDYRDRNRLVEEDNNKSLPALLGSSGTEAIEGNSSGSDFHLPDSSGSGSDNKDPKKKKPKGKFGRAMDKVKGGLSKAKNIATKGGKWAAAAALVAGGGYMIYDKIAGNDTSEDIGGEAGGLGPVTTSDKIAHAIDGTASEIRASVSDEEWNEYVQYYGNGDESTAITNINNIESQSEIAKPSEGSMFSQENMTTAALGLGAGGLMAASVAKRNKTPEFTGEGADIKRATPKPKVAGAIGTKSPSMPKASTLGKGLKSAGSVAKSIGKRIPLANLAFAGLDAYDIISDEEMTGRDKTVGLTGVAGGLGGAAAGAAAGAALGSVVPVVGTLIGGLVGGAAGYFLGDNAASAAADFVLPDNFMSDEGDSTITTNSGEQVEVSKSSMEEYLPRDADGFEKDNVIMKEIQKIPSDNQTPQDIKTFSEAYARQKERIERFTQAVNIKQSMENLEGFFGGVDEADQRQYSQYEQQYNELQNPDNSTINSYVNEGNTYLNKSENTEELTENIDAGVDSSVGDTYSDSNQTTQAGTESSLQNNQADSVVVTDTPKVQAVSSSIEAKREPYVAPQKQAPAPAPSPQQSVPTIGTSTGTERKAPQPAPRPKPSKPTLDDAPIRIDSGGINLITSGVL